MRGLRYLVGEAVTFEAAGLQWSSFNVSSIFLRRKSSFFIVLKLSVSNIDKSKCGKRDREGDRETGVGGDSRGVRVFLTYVVCLFEVNRDCSFIQSVTKNTDPVWGGGGRGGGGDWMNEDQRDRVLTYNNRMDVILYNYDGNWREILTISEWLKEGTTDNDLIMETAQETANNNRELETKGSCRMKWTHDSNHLVHTQDLWIVRVRKDQ